MLSESQVANLQRIMKRAGYHTAKQVFSEAKKIGAKEIEIRHIEKNTRLIYTNYQSRRRRKSKHTRRIDRCIFVSGVNDKGMIFCQNPEIRVVVNAIDTTICARCKKFNDGRKS